MNKDLIYRISLLPALCGVIIWTIGGNHLGFTQNQSLVTIEDPFLGPQPSYIEKFTPGIEIPLAGAILSGSFLVIAFLITRFRKTS